MHRQKAQEFSTLLLASIRAALLAGQAILRIYSSGDFHTRRKEDRSPLTEADLEAHQTILEELQDTGIPVLSEEGRDQDFPVRKDWERRNRGDKRRRHRIRETVRPCLNLILSRAASQRWRRWEGKRSRKDQLERQIIVVQIGQTNPGELQISASLFSEVPGIRP